MSRNIVFNYGDDDLIKRAQALAESNRMQAQKIEIQAREIKVAAAALTRDQEAAKEAKEAFQGKVLNEFLRVKRWINYDDRPVVLGKAIIDYTYLRTDGEFPGKIKVYSGNGLASVEVPRVSWSNLILRESVNNEGIESRAAQIDLYFVLPIKDDACIVLFMTDAYYGNAQRYRVPQGSEEGTFDLVFLADFQSETLFQSEAFYVNSTTVRRVPIPSQIANRPRITVEPNGENSLGAPHYPENPLFAGNIDYCYFGSGDQFYYEGEPERAIPVNTPSCYFGFNPANIPVLSWDNLEGPPTALQPFSQEYNQYLRALANAVKPKIPHIVVFNEPGFFPANVANSFLTASAGYVLNSDPNPFTFEGLQGATRPPWVPRRFRLPPNPPTSLRTIPGSIPEGSATYAERPSLIPYALTFWDWGAPDYCRTQLIALGFNPEDLVA